MRDAGYFRVKASLCLDIARQLSDPRAAADLRAEAADYLARAEGLEGASSLPLPPQSAAGDPGADIPDSEYHSALIV